MWVSGCCVDADPRIKWGGLGMLYVIHIFYVGPFCLFLLMSQHDIKYLETHLIQHSLMKGRTRNLCSRFIWKSVIGGFINIYVY